MDIACYIVSSYMFLSLMLYEDIIKSQNVGL